MSFDMEGKKMSLDLKPGRSTELVERDASKLEKIIKGHVPLGKSGEMPDMGPRPLTTVGALKQAEEKRAKRKLRPLNPSTAESATDESSRTFESKKEKSWVERYMKVARCDRETAEVVYRDALARAPQKKAITD